MNEMIERIVRELTDAQRDFLLVLPPNGEWKATGLVIRGIESRHGRNALRGFGKSGLIEGYYQEERRHRLTDLGMETRAMIDAALNPGDPS